MIPRVNVLLVLLNWQRLETFWAYWIWKARIGSSVLRILWLCYQVVYWSQPGTNLESLDDQTSYYLGIQLSAKIVLLIVKSFCNVSVKQTSMRTACCFLSCRSCSNFGQISQYSIIDSCRVSLPTFVLAVAPDRVDWPVAIFAYCELVEQVHSLSLFARYHHRFCLAAPDTSPCRTRESSWGTGSSCL